jgi:hypothetical protein
MNSINHLISDRSRSSDQSNHLQVKTTVTHRKTSEVWPSASKMLRWRAPCLISMRVRIESSDSIRSSQSIYRIIRSIKLAGMECEDISKYSSVVLNPTDRRSSGFIDGGGSQPSTSRQGSGNSTSNVANGGSANPDNHDQPIVFRANANN